MPPLNFHDQQHLARMFAQDVRINGLFNNLILSVSPDMKRWKDSGRSNVWIRNSSIENNIDKRLIEFKSLLEIEIKSGSLAAWKLSDAKNDILVTNYIKGLALTEMSKNGMFTRNMAALTQLQNRIENGMDLSTRIWNIADQTKNHLGLYLQSGVGTGRSAASIGQDIRQLLNDPNKRFHRIRDLNGELVESQPMKNYHPGQGKYKSSKQNALRLAATETNMGYRVSDCERWKQLDFVLGFEVKRSGNGKPCVICDALKGKYPKSFVFPGWHSWCICYAVPILMEHEDSADYFLKKYAPKFKTDDYLPKNYIKDIPPAAAEWIKNNEVLVGKSYWGKANSVILKAVDKPIAKAISKIPIVNNLSDYELNLLEVEDKLSIKKGNEMSFEEANELRGNINYKDGMQYHVNCQSCVVSNELRRRGYDVTALPNLKKTGNIPYELSRKTEMAWIDQKTGKYPEKFKAGGKLELGKGLSLKPKKIADISKDLNDFTKEVGRYHIDFNWKKRRSGHIITLERLETGTVRLYDPQNGKLVSWAGLSKEINTGYGVNILRVDNLLVNNEIISGVVTRL